MDNPAFTRLARRLDAELLQSWPLTGGVSAQVTALEVRQGGEVRRWVVRQYGAANLSADPHSAEHEFQLLRFLRSAGLPVPTPVHLEDAGDLFPTPVLVTEFVEGKTLLEADAAPHRPEQLAEQLADFLLRLHALAVPPDLLAFLPPSPGPGPRPAVLDASLSEGRIRAALGEHWPPPSPHPLALLHGDFWPGNVLWDSGQIAAVLDWEDAASGNPLADVGNARLELLFFFGPDVMEVFTHRYHRGSGLDLSALPLWDLRAALRPAGRIGTWGLEAETERTLRERHARFVERALGQLG